MTDRAPFVPAQTIDELPGAVHAALDAYYHKDYVPLIQTMDDDGLFIGAGPDVVRGKRDLARACGEDISTPSFHMENPYFEVQALPVGVDPELAELAVVTGFYDLLSEGDRPMLTAVHQRITVIMHKRESVWTVLHVHSSNEWNELVDDEVFPVQISSQTYQYVKRIIEHTECARPAGDRMGPIAIEGGGAIRTVNPDEVLYVRATAKTCDAHLAGRVVPLPCSIAKMEELLTDAQFMRVHRSYLVNPSHVRRFEGDAIVLKNEERIPVPHRRRAEVRDFMRSVVSRWGASQDCSEH